MSARPGTFWDSLTIPGFRRLWLAVTIGNSGRWASTMALGWLVHTWVHSPFWVGAAMFAMQGPILVLAPFAGVLIDRLHRGRLLGTAFACGTLAILGLGFSAAFHLGLAPVLAAALFFGVSFSFQSTTWTALVPPLVPREKLPNAIALLSVARQGTEFVGPALATPILIHWGAPAVFAVASALYLVAATLAFTLSAVGAKAPEERRKQRGVDSLRDGIVYIRRRPALNFLIFFIGVHCVLTMAYQGVLPSVVQRDLGAAAGGYGTVMTAIGVGAVLGSLLLSRIQTPQPMGRALWVTTFLSGVSVMLLGLATSLDVAVLAGFLMGFSQTPFMALTQVYLQERVENAYRGRVTSLRAVVTQGTMSLGNWVWGLAALILPPGPLLLGLGGIFVGAAALAQRRSPTFQRLLFPTLPKAAELPAQPL